MPNQLPVWQHSLHLPFNGSLLRREVRRPVCQSCPFQPVVHGTKKSTKRNLGGGCVETRMPLWRKCAGVLRKGAWTHILYVFRNLMKTRWAVQVSAGQLPFSKIDLLMRMQDMQKKPVYLPFPQRPRHLVLRARNRQCHRKRKVMIPQNRILSKAYARKPVAASFSQCLDRWGREAGAKLIYQILKLEKTIDTSSR